MPFRSDINGLRAIAVIAVVIFHFMPTLLPGGFVGVDVFFVISGYLMTAIVVSGLKEQQFSLLRFYHARVKRILPALAVLCGLLIGLGWFYLYPEDLHQLCKDALASMFFVSNLLYWAEAGYFEPVAHSKWLLHTWSLSVEWQFYLLYPIILWVAYKIFGIALLKAVVILLTVSSFGICVWVANYEPTNAFFLLPTRVWEMTAGGLAFLFPLKLNGRTKAVAVYSGLSAIGLSCVLITPSTLWPGYWTLFPVIGTWVLIQANCQNVGLLNNPVSEKIGRYSYSIYLWHWPIAVLWVYEGINHQPVFILAGFALTGILAYLSYQLVERFNWQRVASLLYIGPAVPVVAAMVIADDAAERSPAKHRTAYQAFDQRDCSTFNRMLPTEFPFCKKYGDQQALDFVIWGDSHAIDFAEFIESQYPDSSFKSFSSLGCPPLLGVRRVDNAGTARACNEGIANAIIKEIEQEKPTKVILIARWGVYHHGWHIDGELQPARHQLCKEDCSDVSEDSSLAVMQSAFMETINRLRQTAEVMVVMPVPVQKIAGNRFRYRSNDEGLVLKASEHEQWQSATKAMIQANQLVGGYRVFDPATSLCQSGICRIESNGELLYFDDNHLNHRGWMEIQTEVIQNVGGFLATDQKTIPLM